MPPATKEDLDRQTAQLERLFEAKMEPFYKRLEGIEECVYGANNEGGLRIQVDRLEQHKERQTWVNRTFGAGIIAGIISAVVSFIKWLVVSKS